MKLIVFSDKPVLVAGLKAALGDDGVDIHMVCSTAAGLSDVMSTQQPDIALLDLMPEVSFAFLSEMSQASVNTKVVLWAYAITTEFAFQAMGLGVRGILRQNLPLAMIAKCLRVVQGGELWFEKAITDEFLKAKRIAVTQREGQLIGLLAQGLKNKDIASALFISDGTVKVYLSRLFTKLGVKDRFELALYGLKNLTSGQGAVDGAMKKALSRPHIGYSPPLPGLRSIVLKRDEASV